MSVMLSASDIIDIAVQTETRGERFYRDASEASEQPDVRELFTYLADEESRHREFFSGLEPASLLLSASDPEWADAVAYIEATVDAEFFSDQAPIRLAPEEPTTDGRLRQAIQFERQTLLFFYALRDLASAATAATIDAVIAEEKLHVRRLSAILKQRRG